MLVQQMQYLVLLRYGSITSRGTGNRLNNDPCCIDVAPWVVLLYPNEAQVLGRAYQRV